MPDVESAGPARFVIVPQRKIGTKILGLVVVVLLAMLVRAFWVGDIAWSYVGANLLSPSVLKGVVNSIIMTFCAMALGIVLGVAAAVMRMSDNQIGRAHV